MASLSVNIDDLRKTAQELDSYNEQFKQKLGDIDNINNNLSTVWKGNDADKYIGAVRAQAEMLKKLYSSIDNMTSEMKDIAKRYENALINNLNNINM